MKVLEDEDNEPKQPAPGTTSPELTGASGVAPHANEGGSPGSAAPLSGSAAAPAPAPAPPPPEGTPVATRGFKPSSSRVWIELAVLGAVLLALGGSAIWGGGVLAESLTPWVPLSVDRRLGELSEASLGQADCPDAGAKAYVQELARVLTECGVHTPFSFQFRVADDATVNAFALPGGWVTVNSGLLQAAQSSEEVAGVLAHELQHVVLRHGTRRLLREMGGSFALSLLLGGSDLKSHAAIGAKVASLRYERDEELAADRAGIELLERCGIEASGLAQFFDRMVEQGRSPPEFFSTHPDPGERARRARSRSTSGNPTPARALPILPKPIRCGP
ncbi:MAG TPA: M48 family metallopeptidase [Polyangiaceae bacterium]|nr:M48 family metallopeptidase [Polyangiaceae bacterium]